MSDEEAMLAPHDILQFCTRWSLPPLPGEVRMAHALLRKARQPMFRLDDAFLRESGFREGMCHSNVANAVRELTGKTHVLGWVVEDPLLHIHSAIWDGEKFICVSPRRNGAQLADFIPDTALSIERGPSSFKIFLNHVDVSDRAGLRADVARVKRAMRQMLSSFSEGEDGEQVAAAVLRDLRQTRQKRASR